jgi:hypothetical protein
LGSEQTQTHLDGSERTQQFTQVFDPGLNSKTRSLK